MLKVRVVPTLLHKGFGLVKGVHFDSRRAVGSPVQAVKGYNLRNVDELVFLDVSATAECRGQTPLQNAFGLVDRQARRLCQETQSCRLMRGDDIELRPFEQTGKPLPQQHVIVHHNDPGRRRRAHPRKYPP